MMRMRNRTDRKMRGMTARSVHSDRRLVLINIVVLETPVCISPLGGLYLDQYCL